MVGLHARVKTNISGDCTTVAPCSGRRVAMGPLLRLHGTLGLWVLALCGLRLGGASGAGEHGSVPGALLGSGSGSG